MRVLVCGGRDYGSEIDHRIIVAREMYRAEPISLIIHGGAKGADWLAGRWAELKGIPVLEFPAKWSEFGKSAGPIRNQRMLDEGKPDLVIAFPGGRGTADMVRRARAANIEVREVEG